MRKRALLLGLLLLLSGCALRLSPPEAAELPPAAVPAEPVLPPDPEPPEVNQGLDTEPGTGGAEEPSTDMEPSAELEPADGTFVRAADVIPGILVDLRYASDNNFTGTVIYDFSDAYLRWGTAKKLKAVQDSLAEQGYGLLIWDAFRPPAAQFALWDICPDPVYVADPTKGFSSHSRGNTVDVTLVTADGAPVEMPTDFDDFTALADRDYADVPETAAANALLLEEAMEAAGFRPYRGEWWHFSDSVRYDVEERFTP